MVQKEKGGDILITGVSFSIPLCVCVCVCGYTHTHTYIYIYIYMCVCVCVCVCVRVMINIYIVTFVQPWNIDYYMDPKTSTLRHYRANQTMLSRPDE